MSASTDSAERSSAIHRAWTQYSLVAIGVGAIILTGIIAVAPGLYAIVVENVLLPRYETTFGFRGARISIDEADESDTRYAIVEVTPGGVLDAAGVRTGDIPIDYHGGMEAFHGALHEASQGGSGRFVVVSREDGYGKRRAILVSK